MARYFFHLAKGSEIVVRDVTGHECADDGAARQHARRSDDLIAARGLAVAVMKEYSIRDTNEAGQVLFTVPLSKLEPPDNFR